MSKEADNPPKNGRRDDLAEGGDPATWSGWDEETGVQLRALFTEEAQEHLEVMHRAVMMLHVDEGSLQEFLRRAHTLKGAAATVGFEAVGRAAHLLEERCIELKRSGAGLPTEDTADQLVSALDTLEKLFVGEGDDEELLEEMRRSLGGSGIPHGSAVVAREGRKTKEGSGRRLMRDRRRGDRRRAEGAQVMRVDAAQIEDLMNAVGQLVIDRTRIERQVEHLKGLARDLAVSHRALRDAVVQVGGQAESSELRRVAEVELEIADALGGLQRAATAFTEESDGLGRTTRALKDSLTAVGMMPMRWIYTRLQRPLRDLARAEGKSVELRTEGESTEIDRSVAEKISDPLIHLVRNAIAHGIETPEQRRQLGKAEGGLIRITARHQENMLVVDVEDDGAGIDPEGLQKAARRLGMMTDAVPADGDGLIDLIFASGFSTRVEADGIAGRGLGLDVVRQNVIDLGGDLRVVSRPGEGTRFTIRLPTTTAITQALLFKEGDHAFAIPVAYVVGTHAVDASSTEQREGLWRALVRGRWLSLVRLDELFSWGAAEAPFVRSLPLIELASGNDVFAVSCRRIIGPREIVVKQLGPLLGALPFFSGATISGSGKVQLVLDVASMAELARRGGIPLAARQLSTLRRPRGVVLVADDSLSTREALGMMLRAVGFSVDAAADGWEAWERLQTRRYDLLVTDLEMPRVHGTELIRRCRRQSGLATLPILVLTSRTAEHNLEAAGQAGADDCLKKPVNRRLILERVNDLLQKRRA